MQAGKLRHRVAIQSFTEAADASGQVINSFSTIANVWARVTPKSGSEFTNEGVSKIQTVYEVEIRYTGDLNTTYRLLHNTKTLNITSVLDIDDRNRKMILLCIEDVS